MTAPAPGASPAARASTSVAVRTTMPTRCSSRSAWPPRVRPVAAAARSQSSCWCGGWRGRTRPRARGRRRRRPARPRASPRGSGARAAVPSPSRASNSTSPTTRPAASAGEFSTMRTTSTPCGLAEHRVDRLPRVADVGAGEAAERQRPALRLRRRAPRTARAAPPCRATAAARRAGERASVQAAPEDEYAMRSQAARGEQRVGSMRSRFDTAAIASGHALARDEEPRESRTRQRTTAPAPRRRRFVPEHRLRAADATSR